ASLLANPRRHVEYVLQDGNAHEHHPPYGQSKRRTGNCCGEHRSGIEVGGSGDDAVTDVGRGFLGARFRMCASTRYRAPAAREIQQLAALTLSFTGFSEAHG